MLENSNCKLVSLIDNQIKGAYNAFIITWKDTAYFIHFEYPFMIK